MLPDLGRDPALLILISLAGGEKHGYAMMQDIEALTGTHIGPGTLYAALTRLETRGWIEGVASDDRRKPYRLTSAGRAALSDQIGGMNALIQAGMRRLGAT